MIKTKDRIHLRAGLLFACLAFLPLHSHGSPVSLPTSTDAGLVAIPVEGEALVFYQAAPLENPKGGDAFKGSNFIHPLKTPSGFKVTHSQPADHPHHFGLWWPWKFIEHEGRRIVTWELQQGQGIVEARSNERLPNGLTTRSVYINRTLPEGPKVALHETTQIRVSEIVSTSTGGRGYFLDLEIEHTPAGDSPIVIRTHRYSGLGFRGSALWDKGNSTLLTSEGADRYAANASAARWIRVEGTNGDNGSAGVLIMGHPSNHAHPEKLRTWDTQHEGAIFVNFNPVMDEPWTFVPGQTYTRNYRLFIYDGTLTEEAVEEIWQNYALLSALGAQPK